MQTSKELVFFLLPYFEAFYLDQFPFNILCKNIWLNAIFVETLVHDQILWSSATLQTFIHSVV